MNANILRTFARTLKPYHISKNVFCSSVEQESTPPVIAPKFPIIKKFEANEAFRVTSEDPREAWVEGLTSTKEEKVGLVTLHPDIFAVVPRIDIIHENVVWQLKYKKVNYRHARVPCEMRGPGKGFGRKPWPQKGTGRARFKSTRAPQWVKGGTVHGPRRFTTKFYMLPLQKRVMGLAAMLSCKLAQDDLKIVPSLDIPSDEPTFLEELVEERCWGTSVLFVNLEDYMPRNITLATDEIDHYNLLPVYGLNVHSMLKHDTLVLTLEALDKIQERLLHHLHRPLFHNDCFTEYKH